MGGSPGGKGPYSQAKASTEDAGPAKPGQAGMVREEFQPGAETVLRGAGLNLKVSLPRSPTRTSLRSQS